MATGEVWRDAGVATAFVAERARRVPETGTQLAVLLHVLGLRRTPVRRVVDLGCGDGVLLATVLEAFPEATGVGLDYSPAMVELARDRLAAFGARARVAPTDLRTSEWTAEMRERPDAVVSGFAIHHLPDARKRALYQEVHRHLLPGGTFLNLEHVASATPEVERLAEEGLVAFQAAVRRSAGETVDVEALRATHLARSDKADNILVRVETQCRWLREIGFEDVDVFWKWFELALFGGSRPCS